MSFLKSYLHSLEALLGHEAKPEIIRADITMIYSSFFIIIPTFEYKLY